MACFYFIQVFELAQVLGINCASEPFLLWIVQEALQTPLPPKWQIRVEIRDDDELGNRKQSVDSDLDYSEYIQQQTECKNEDSSEAKTYTLDAFYMDVDSGEETDVHPAFG
jgi:hypothetical protein